jgi:uracil-DNA glycosylase family 4
VLFCGEAPGPSEDVLNKPFSGPSGKLLDSIIDDAKTISGMNSLTIGLTNLVGCIPRGDDLRKFGEPSPESIEACLERLDEIIALCSPSLIVSVGKLAKENLKGLEAGYHLVNIVHPAAIMRADISQQKLMVKNATIILADAFEDCFASV